MVNDEVTTFVDAANADGTDDAVDIAIEEDGTSVQGGLIIAGEGQTVDDVVVPTGKPINEMNASEQKALADKIVDEIDANDEGIPFLPLNLGKFTVWSFEHVYLPPEEPGAKPDSNPGIIITLASPDDPRGTPYILSRDRAIKFASQLKKRAQTGPSIQQRAAVSGIAVPTDAPQFGGLILPGH